MAASSSSSSKVAGEKYDVFISFRGSDTRHGFLSHLKKALRQEGIDVYVDERIQRGDEISSALVEAIEGSLISLVIFSKDYASSKWCLEELVKIMECKQVNQQILIPIFYDVDPSDVKHQKGTYEDAFNKHEEKFKDNMDKLRKFKDNMGKLRIWRSTLSRAAKVAGHTYSSILEDEYDVINKIIKGVLKKLDEKAPIIEPKPPVGFNENLASIESFMKNESQRDQIIGIWGMGGIGKTTLARVIFNKYFSQFDTSYFAKNVREESKRINGLSNLCEKIHSALLNEKNLEPEGGHDMATKRRLQRKRVLLVLDDVDSTSQLQYIREDLSLGPGSKVIITSRDRHVLITEGVHALHEVKALNKEESLQLFCLHAFKQGHPKIGYEKLSTQAIEYARGLPLALKVLGSYLTGRDTKAWESALRKLRKYPNVEIQNVLRVSYDGLDKTEKNIFLDNAFFFKGKQKDGIIRFLDACDFYPDCGIVSLVDKSLITISRDNTIEIHDLLQEMAEEIVCEESPEHPGRRSRLNDAEEIRDVLQNSMGTEAIEGIILEPMNIKDLQHWNPDAFINLINLRFLKINYGMIRMRGCSYLSDLKIFSKKLRYLDCNCYPFKSLELGFCLEKLVEIHLQHSKVEKLWDGVQDLMNLRIINLSGSHNLKELPDFSMAHNLEIMYLRCCFNLHAIHPSIFSLHTLVSLDLTGCSRLKRLCSEKHLKSLKYLTLYRCYRLKELLLSSEEMIILDLSHTSIKTLNFATGRFNKLEVLCLSSSLRSFQVNELCCLTSLKTFRLDFFKKGIDKMKLHILFDALHSLEELHLSFCGISEIPDNISALSSLKVLSLRGNRMKNLPTSIKHLSKLKEICLSNCERLRSLPELPTSITHFDVSKCTSLETTRFSSIIFMLEHDEEESFSFSWRNCLKLGLDRHDIMEFTHFLLIRAIYNCGKIEVSYPGSTIPKWFRYSQTPNTSITPDTSITIELAPTSSDHLLGFVCYCICSQSDLNDFSCIYWSIHFKDEEIKGGHRKFFLYGGQLNMDHVILWYAPLDYILKGTKRRGYDEGTISKLKFQIHGFQQTRVAIRGSIKASAIDDSIKASAVGPIYASQIYELIQQMKLDMKEGTKRKRSHNLDDVFVNIVGSGDGCSFYENQGQQKFIHMMKQKHLRKMR